MYELIILSILMRVPAYGYLLAKVIRDIIGPWSSVSNGTLYPLLARLEQAGLIAASDDEGKKGSGDRHARIFTITEAGRRRFHQLMMDTSTKQGEYEKLFHLKVRYFYQLKPRERLHLVNHYINYCQAQILYFKSEAEDFVHEHEQNDTYVENTLDVMQHKETMWQTELDWAIHVRIRETRRIEQEAKQQTPSSAGEDTPESLL